MADYLVFRLYGPMCSWGEIAVGESRHTADHPSRSALLGLFGAALGIERVDEPGQQSLFAAWRFGLKVLSVGTLLRDYHTVQAPRKERKTVYRTRRQELCAPVVNTLLSSREYRVDSMCIVAAEAAVDSPWPPEAMRDALQTPRFALYLGRKSCPPALPLAPRVVTRDTLREALDAEQLPLAELTSRHAPARGAAAQTGPVQTLPPPPPWPSPSDERHFSLIAPRFYWEGGMVPSPDTEMGGSMAPNLEFARHDQPLSRRRWQFAPRREFAHFTSERPA